LTFSESEYAAGASIPLHVHANPFFCLILKGESTETVAGEARINVPSMLVYHPAEEPHANRWLTGGRCFHIEVGTDRWQILTRDAPLLACPSVFRSIPILALAHRIHQEFEDMDSYSPLVLDGLVLQLLAGVSRPQSRESCIPRWLERVREILHESFDRSLTMTDIAEAAGVHPAHLSRTFRQYFRQTPGEYVRRIRVEAAARLLANSSLSISEIAQHTGFADQSHLTKRFAREFGTTPRAYRQATAAQKADKGR
jgi:AraC family transcriptional regulator